MFGKRNQNSDIIIAMSMFSFNDDPVVVPVETTEEPTKAIENKEFFVEEYEGVTEEDYATAEEPDFWEDA